MQKVIYGIFAHPDDEAFGVSPTLIQEVHTGTEIHLVTLTSGQNGTNPDQLEDLGAARLDEWRHGGEIMGVHAMHHFGYIDGQLCNEMIDEISERLTALVLDTIHATPDAVIEFMTFDFTGLTGHIDHIVATHAACLTFFRLKAQFPVQMSRVRLKCTPASQLSHRNIDWRYMEAGREDSSIDEIIDARQYHDEIIHAIRAHHTQRADGEMHIANHGQTIGINHFMILE